MKNSKYAMKPLSESERWYVFDIESDNLYDQVTKIHCIVIHDINRNQTTSYGPDRIGDALECLANGHVLIGLSLIHI